MRVAAVLFALNIASAGAFAPSTAFRTQQSSSTSVHMTASDNSSTRVQFLQQIGAAAFGSTLLLPNVANAAKYGGFGAGSPEVINPKDAIIDDEILGSEDVQKALTGIKGYVAAVKGMQDLLVKDPQADISPYVRKYLEVSQLRTDLNTFNTIFDEDTQRGTDRLIRIVVQNISELEISNKQKPGVARSQIRLDNLNGKLSKLSTAFSDLLAFV